MKKTAVNAVLLNRRGPFIFSFAVLQRSFIKNPRTVQHQNKSFENQKDGPRKIKNSTALDSFFDDMDQELELQYEEEEFEFFLMGPDSKF